MKTVPARMTMIAPTNAKNINTKNTAGKHSEDKDVPAASPQHVHELSVQHVQQLESKNRGAPVSRPRPVTYLIQLISKAMQTCKIFEA